jgi:hypothetical protein
MTKKKKAKRESFAELAGAMEQLRSLQREFGMSDGLVDEMLREAEDGFALGLGAVPPAYPARFGLSPQSRVALMSALSSLACVSRDRVARASERNAPLARAA